MEMITFFLILFIGALIAGLLGSLTGLGGGVVIIPLLTIGLGVDIRYAIGTSLVAVIATSSGAAAAYVREGITNMRIGMFLEIATTIGAICGAAIALIAPTHALAVIFGIVLLYSAANSFLNRQKTYPAYVKPVPGDRKLSVLLNLGGSYPATTGQVFYNVFNVVGGFILMIVAGILSGLLGIGSGAFKVLAMDGIMKIPYKVSSATSNFMIGVTAAASAGIYLSRGYIDPVLSMPIVPGILIGATIGARTLMVSRTRKLKVVFAIVITLLAVEMIYNGIAKNL
jgi:uncharacterized membrane protein YfcA